MTHPRLGLLGLTALLAALASCAAPPSPTGAGVMPSPDQAAAPAPQHPGPGWLLLGVAEGRKKHDKRHAIAERDWARDKARLMRARG